MIVDKANGRLADIKTFARETNLLENFNNTFSILKTYSAKGYTVIIYSDIALHYLWNFPLLKTIELSSMVALYFMAHIICLEMVVFQFSQTEKGKD